MRRDGIRGPGGDPRAFSLPQYVRAERRLGEILKRMAATGERATNGEPKSQQMSRGATSAPTLSDLGIPRDRASRAMQLARGR